MTRAGWAGGAAIVAFAAAFGVLIALGWAIETMQQRARRDG